MKISRKQWTMLQEGWRTIGDSLPVRREGAVIPDAPNGCFSIGWWRGPVLYFRRGNFLIECGAHCYTTRPHQHVGVYAEATNND
jgi:hypothetical protein